MTIQTGATEESQNNYKQLKFGKLNLVDLAGSERVRITVSMKKLKKGSDWETFGGMQKN